jgi:hypothetical protein
MKSPATYCNPLPLPNYPRGVMTTPQHKKKEMFWLRDDHNDFRETADPTVIWDEPGQRWILYPSGSMAYVSTDGVTWQHHPIEPHEVGYAPTVAKVGQQWWLTGSGHGLYVAEDPLGPFVEKGPVLLPNGQPLPKECAWLDPMLFEDDDGRLYGYWGIGGGIWGAEMDPSRPGQLLSEPQKFIRFDPSHAWERGGAFHQHQVSCTEGAWMFKGGGKYWLTYSAPGTNPMYCMGAYVGNGPLGPFEYASHNPILDGRNGRFVQGAGHGCIVPGPGGTLWAFYTCHIQIHHLFERRIGMDPAGFDEQGRLFICRPSDTPQWAPGSRPHPEQGNATGWQPVTFRERITASSYLPGREPGRASDLNPQSWWQATPQDASPWIEADLYSAQSVRAFRLHWKEPGLDYDAGIAPTPMRWRLLGRKETTDPWESLADHSNGSGDWLIAYHELREPQSLRYLRLELAEHPGPIGVGLIDFSIFAEIP